MVGLYFGGMVAGVLVALFMRRTLFLGEAVPFVMELPSYRLPSLRNVGQLLWEKAKDFLERAFTVIFLATIVIWFLQTFDFGLNVVEDSADSMLAVVAGWVAPLFAPLGFGDWRVSTALVTGVMAKESVVSTLSILFGSTEALVAALAPLAALGTAGVLPAVHARASRRSRRCGASWAGAGRWRWRSGSWAWPGWRRFWCAERGLRSRRGRRGALSAALAVALAVSAALAWRRSRRRGRAGLGCDAGCAGCAARAEVAAEDEPRAEAR